MIRLTSEGRGKHYSRVRGAMESSLRILYGRGWAGELWGRLPARCDVEVRAHAMPILAPGASPLRVGFVSDIHLGPTTPRAIVERAFDHLARMRLDVLLLGGDYVFLDATDAKADALARLVERVPARRKLAVLGNHDLWTRHELLERALDRAGVELVENRSVVLEASHGPVRVVGLDEPWTGDIDAARALAGATHAETHVVLCHSPDGVPFYRDAIARASLPRAALFVCGHTHGGHIAAPWGPLYVPGRQGKRYPAGLFEERDLRVFVSRGVGGIELPVRAFARPEVALFELSAAPLT